MKCEDMMNTITEYKLAALIEKSAAVVYDFLYSKRVANREPIMKSVITCLNSWAEEMGCTYKIMPYVFMEFNKNVSAINAYSSKQLMTFRNSERPMNAKQGMTNIISAVKVMVEKADNIQEGSYMFLWMAFKNILSHYGASKEEKDIIASYLLNI